MRKLQLVALLIAALVMSIPIVSAQELSVSVSGRDNVNGNIRAKDTLLVDAIASIPNEEIISPSQMRLYYEDSYAFFENCTRIGDTPKYRCTFSDESFEAYQALQFRIELRNDDDKIVKSETRPLKVDWLAPDITTFSISPNQTTSDVTIRYAAQDYGFVAGSIQECSGIKKTTFTLNGKTVIEDAGQANTCVRESQFTTKLNESGSLCARTFDRLNQSSSQRCAKVIVDAQPPNIREPGIIGNKGLPVTHIRKDQGTTATVAITIQDEVGVDKGTVQADLSAISPELKDFRPPSRVTADVYAWENVALVEPATCKVSARAKDKLGNAASKEFACSIRADNVGPEFSSIVSDRQRDNVPLYGKGTVLFLEFDEKDSTGAAGIGLNRRQVYLDLSELGMIKFQQANTCASSSGSQWICSWPLVPPAGTPEGTYPIKIAQGTADDLDNLLVVGDKTAVSIVYDDSPPAPPEIVDFRILKGEETGNITGAVAGNFAQYTLRSANFTDAFANFTDIGGRAVVGVCGVPENDTQGFSECMFEQKIELSGPYYASTFFTFTDDAGNKAETNHTFEVLGVDNATRAKYWNSEVVCTPSLINRATASVIAPYVSCRVHLTTKRTDIRTYAIRGPQEPSECGGDTEAILGDVYTTNANEGSTVPIVIFKLEAKDYYLNTLNITCPLLVTSKRVDTGGRSGYVSPNPQVIPINLSTQFYNEPQRDMYGEIDRQIQDAIKDGLANAEWLGTLRKALYYFELLCQIKTIITSIVQVFTMVTILLGTLELITAVNPFTSGAAGGIAGAKAALCGGGRGVETTYESIVKYLDMFCFFINCKGNYPASKPRGEAPAAPGTPAAPGAPAAPGTAGPNQLPRGESPTIDVAQSIRDAGSALPANAPAPAPAAAPSPEASRPPIPEGGEAPGLPGSGRAIQTATTDLTVPFNPLLTGVTGAQAAAPAPSAGVQAGAPPEKTTAQTITSVASGGVNPLCNALAETLGMGMPNIRDSLFWSVLCVCLPGIVYNVEKLRQVNCYKAVCLNDEVKERGYPVSYCEEMYQYNLCQYVIGQVWAAIPFSGVADKLTSLLTDLLTNPLTLVTLGLAIVCQDFCEIEEPSGSTALFAFCATVQTLSLLSDAVSQVVTMSRTKDLFKSPPGTYCKRMDKIKDEMEKLEKEQEQATSTNSTEATP